MVPLVLVVQEKNVGKVGGCCEVRSQSLVSWSRWTPSEYGGQEGEQVIVIACHTVGISDWGSSHSHPRTETVARSQQALLAGDCRPSDSPRTCTREYAGGVVSDSQGGAIEGSEGAQRA